MKLAKLLTSMLLALAACEQKTQFKDTCETDNQCPSGFLCRSGLCVCRNDESCEDNQFCNTQGICQDRPGCLSNTDCEPAKFCNITTGVCIDRTSCGTDVHCIPGQVCNHQTNLCVDGCRNDGDCPLYGVCQKTDTSSTSLGTCLSGRCGDKSFCAFGERCINGSCARDNDPNHCAACNNQRGDCGSEQNFCLINVNYDPQNPAAGTEFYCGVSCQAQEDCPNGYDCSPIILLTQSLCMQDNECGGGGRQCVIREGDVRGNCTCATNADCNSIFERAAPATCITKTCGGLGFQACETNADCSFLPCQGSGTGTCQFPQGQSCTLDSQCQDLPLCADLGLGQKVCVSDPLLQTTCNSAADCLCISGSCAGSGRPCSQASDCQLECQGGGCVLGAACGPSEGLSCELLP